jgi:hypothetical protein
MDFVVGLPRSPRGKDAIWVVIDRLTKVAHFLPMKTNNSASDLVPLYIKEVVRLHGVPKSIVPDRDSKLYQIFGRVHIVLWVLIWTLALLFTLR